MALHKVLVVVVWRAPVTSDAEKLTRFGRRCKDTDQTRTWEHIVEPVHSVAWFHRQHRGDEQAMAIEVEGHLELAQELNVLLAVSLREDVAPEDVGEHRGSKDASFRTWYGFVCVCM